MEVLPLGCGLPQLYLLRDTLPLQNPRQRRRCSLFGSGTSQSLPRLSHRSGASLACEKGCYTSALFLPFLQQDDEDEEVEDREEEEKNKEQMSTLKSDDPIKDFFKTRIKQPTTNSDPDHLLKTSLSKNLKASSHPSQYSRVGGIVGEILEKAQKLPENVTLGEVLEEFKGRIGKRECVEVLKLLEKYGLVKCCTYFFEWMGTNDPPLLSPQATSTLFPILGRAKMGKEILLIFQTLPNKTPFRDVRVYNSAMSGLSTSEMHDATFSLYETMQVRKVKPDHVTCSILLTSMRKSKKRHTAKEAWELFEKMNTWKPEAVSALLKTFCDEGLIKEALILHSEMEKRGVPSNTIIYNTIMDAFAKSKSNGLEEAEAIFSEMKSKGIPPETSTYNVLIDAYRRRGIPEGVENLLEEMEEAGLKPNVKTYTSLISAYGRDKKTAHLAVNAFLRMKKAGIEPTAHSYTALIHAHSVSGFHEKARAAFETMRADDVEPSAETYTALLDAFRRSGDPETLMKLWKSMRREKVVGTRATLDTVVDGLAKRGEYADARDVVAEFGKAGVRPTVGTYNMVMNAYARGGRESKLRKLLEEMEARGLKPDSATYSTMIYAFVRVRDFKSAFYYHQVMVASGAVPDGESYWKLRAILEEKADVKNGKDRRALKGIVRSRMGVFPKEKRAKDPFWKERKSRKRDRNHKTGWGGGQERTCAQ